MKIEIFWHKMNLVSKEWVWKGEIVLSQSGVFRILLQLQEWIWTTYLDIFHVIHTDING